MENIELSDVSLLSDDSHRNNAEKLALRCGIRADLKGYDYLVDAVILSGTGACTRICEIYSRIGAFRRAKPKSVMRAVSYATKNAPELPRRLGE
ncbi:MAG: sporulation initiation factor Spo0A C-terminal domain-containing protein, partial [Clostridiales bacterium]|nr:sporulation initiation factor Spo0A C-terminal domain-containing protein [Clostridiales bacterium]